MNRKNQLIQTVLEIKDKEYRKDDVKIICEQVYDLAMMSHKPLEPEAMIRFIDRSNRILARFVG